MRHRPVTTAGQPHTPACPGPGCGGDAPKGPRGRRGGRCDARRGQLRHAWPGPSRARAPPRTHGPATGIHRCGRQQDPTCGTLQRARPCDGRAPRPSGARAETRPGQRGQRLRRGKAGRPGASNGPAPVEHPSAADAGAGPRPGGDRSGTPRPDRAGARASHGHPPAQSAHQHGRQQDPTCGTLQRARPVRRPSATPRQAHTPAGRGPGPDRRSRSSGYAAKSGPTGALRAGAGRPRQHPQAGDSGPAPVEPQRRDAHDGRAPRPVGTRPGGAGWWPRLGGAAERGVFGGARCRPQARVAAGPPPWNTPARGQGGRVTWRGWGRAGAGRGQGPRPRG